VTGSGRRRAGLALLGGVTCALSVAPFGWWPLAVVGCAVLCTQLADAPARRRAVIGTAFAAGLYGVGLAWVKEFTVPGMVVFMVFVAVQTGVVAALVPPGRGRHVAFPAVMVAAEAFRSVWPFGGLPLSGIDLGQAGGPLLPTVALGGRLLLVGTVAVGGVALSGAVARRWVAAGVAAAVLVALPLAGALAPAGRPVGALRVAVVQGGGPRGIPAQEADTAAVFAAHLAASARVRPPVDLVLWPEDVVDVARFAGSPEETALRRLARRLRATVVAGVVEDAGPRRFRNFAVAIGPDGEVVDRYEKVHRVPFGEYFPFRSLLERFATLPAADAVPGPRRPGLLRTRDGPVAVTISYEVFFQDRAASGVRAGGEVLLVPTNASSFTTGQMPAQELAAARLRARQTGRDVVQAAPTGFSAVVDHHGRVRAHTDLGRRQVLQTTVQRRVGQTPYTRAGDGPVLAAAAAAALAGWARERRRPGAGRVPVAPAGRRLDPAVKGR
jgi:apolipoprotein N-acyltransferase